MNIDWSKAPERAIAALVRQPLFVDRVETFHEAGIEYFCGEDVSGLPYRLHGGRVTKVDRPSTWTGEGLPPVGTVCEVCSDLDSWEVCTVLAHNGSDVVFVDAKGIYGGLDELRRFRVHRTPEQIAAEERDKAINDMVAISPMLDKHFARKVCAALYDHGYRKQEQTK